MVTTVSSYDILSQANLLHRFLHFQRPDQRTTLIDIERNRQFHTYCKDPNLDHYLLNLCYVKAFGIEIKISIIRQVHLGNHHPLNVIYMLIVLCSSHSDQRSGSVCLMPSFDLEAVAIYWQLTDNTQGYLKHFIFSLF